VGHRGPRAAQCSPSPQHRVEAEGPSPLHPALIAAATATGPLGAARGEAGTGGGPRTRNPSLSPVSSVEHMGIDQLCGDTRAR
jgi:hypothetical protein